MFILLAIVIAMFLSSCIEQEMETINNSVDTEGPNRSPGDLFWADEVNCTSVVLNWDDSLEPVDELKISDVGSDGPWTLLATNPTKPYEVTGLTENTTYWFKLVGEDELGDLYVVIISVTTIQYVPEIEISQVSNGGTYGFGNVYWGANKTITFTVQNLGEANLTLNGSPRVSSSSSRFAVTQQPGSPVLAGQSTTFKIKYTPTGIGNNSVTITISNNDSDENPYTFTVTGKGVYGPGSISVTLVGSGAFCSTSFKGRPYIQHTKKGYIKNTGSYIIGLTGSPKVGMTGSSTFSVTSQPSKTYLDPGESTDFYVTFAPSSDGNYSATISVKYNSNKTKSVNISGKAESWGGHY